MISDAHAADAAHGVEGGEHAAGAFPPFDASLFSHQLIWFFIAFIGLYLIMSRVALPRVGAVVDKRAATVKGDLSAAAQASATADAARDAAEQAKAKAHAEARGLIEEMRQKTQAELAGHQAKADQALAERGAAAEARINAARTKALAEVDGIAGDLAREIVGKLLPKGA
jgi:F-type H+-transporting ATPase subunit b